MELRLHMDCVHCNEERWPGVVENDGKIPLPNERHHFQYDTPLDALLAVIDGFTACPTCGAKRAHPDMGITHRDGCELAAAVERLGEVR